MVIFGLSATFLGIIGIFRFPDFYPKLHAASVVESFGMPICLTGFACIKADIINSVKLILAALLIFLLNPVETHALGNAWLLSMSLLQKQESRKNELWSCRRMTTASRKKLKTQSPDHVS